MNNRREATTFESSPLSVLCMLLSALLFMETMGGSVTWTDSGRITACVAAVSAEIQRPRQLQHFSTARNRRPIDTEETPLPQAGERPCVTQ
jgi:hypothetical protein